MPRNSYSLPVLTKIRIHDPFTSIRSRTRLGLAKAATKVPAGITTLPLPNAFTSWVTSPNTGVSRLDESTVKISAHGMSVARGKNKLGSGTGVGELADRAAV